MKPVDRVVFQPTVYRDLQKGIHKIVHAVRPTFGPQHGTVMLQHINHALLPEVVDDGGLIARRIIELPDRNEDVGAMMVRHLMWRMHERFGDATVTSALIYQTVFDLGVRHVSNGGNAMMLRRALDKGAMLVNDELSKKVVRVTEKSQLFHLATSLCRDEDLSKHLAEIFTRVGQYGQVDIRAGRGRESLVEYKNGMTWKGEFFARSMFQDKFKFRSEMENAAILVSNLIIADPYELAEWLAKMSAEGVTRLFILAREMSENCIAVLEAARCKPEQFDVLAVKLWETSERWELQDLSMLTGGQMFVREAGYTLKNIKPEQLGHARQVWVERSQFGVIDGGGDAELIRKHTLLLLEALKTARDKRYIEKLRGRIAAIAGVTAIFWIGGITQTEIEARVVLATRAAGTLRSSLEDGVFPGGAIVLLECLPVLEGMLKSDDFDERAAGRMIAAALQAPIQALISNCGETPSSILAQIKKRGAGYGYEIESRKVTLMADAGILDAANAVKAAAYAGITGAALGLTVEVVIHPKKRKESYTTG